MTVMLLAFFAAFFYVFLVSMMLPEVDDPEFLDSVDPQSCESGALSNTIFTDPFLNVATLWVILTIIDCD